MEEKVPSSRHTTLQSDLGNSPQNIDISFFPSPTHQPIDDENSGVIIALLMGKKLIF